MVKKNTHFRLSKDNIIELNVFSTLQGQQLRHTIGRYVEKTLEQNKMGKSYRLREISQNSLKFPIFGHQTPKAILTII